MARDEEKVKCPLFFRNAIQAFDNLTLLFFIDDDSLAQKLEEQGQIVSIWEQEGDSNSTKTVKGIDELI